MKNYFAIILLALTIAGCNNENKEAKPLEETKIEKKVITVLTVDQLLEQKENLIDKEIVFKGTVDHVCKHSGRKAYVFGSTEDLRVKIEAKGEITGFDADLIGSEIEVKGIVKELRIDEAYINQMEDNMDENHGGVNHEEGHDEEKEHAEQEERIKDLRKEIALLDKGYKSTYYVEGTSFKKLD